MCSLDKIYFYHWEDKRDKRNGGVVTLKSDGEIYGQWTKDTDSELRIKFALLSFSQIPYTFLFKIPFRIGSLLSGDFVQAGRHFAKIEWQLERQEWSLRDHPQASLPPGQNDLFVKTVKYSLRQLAKNIALIITLPFAMLALTFTALYGMINPLDARKIFSDIEELTSRDLIPTSLNLKSTYIGFRGDYSAPCMQSKTVADRRNFYKEFKEYDPLETRSLLRNARQLLNEKKRFFENEGKYEEFSKEVEKLTREFKIFSEDEPNSHLAKAKAKLLLTTLQECQDKREKFIDNCREVNQNRLSYRNIPHQSLYPLPH